MGKKKRTPLGQDVDSPALRQARKDFVAEHENHEIDATRAEALATIVRSLTKQELEDFVDIVFLELPANLTDRLWEEIDCTAR